MTKLLSKLAYDRLHKKADNVSMVKDYVGTGVTPMILGAAGVPVTTYGHLMGAFDKPLGYDYFKLRAKANDGYLGYLPGVGAYHWTKRRVDTNKHFGDESPRAREVARAVGGTISGVATLGLADLTAAIAAGITKRRTDEEQRQAATGSKWKYLIPGYATYDYFKTQGKSMDLDEKAKKEVEAEKDNPEKKEGDTSSKQASFIQGYVDNVKENPLTHIGAATGVILSLLTSKGTMTDRAIDAGLSGASGAIMGFAGDTVMDARRGVNEQRARNRNTITINIPKPNSQK